MPRYKHIETSPRFLAVNLEAQLLPGTFEHALNYLLDHQFDLSGFDSRFHSSRWCTTSRSSRITGMRSEVDAASSRRVAAVARQRLQRNVSDLRRSFPRGLERFKQESKLSASACDCRKREMGFSTASTFELRVGKMAQPF